MWHVLVSSLGRRRRDLAGLAVWAAVEALPAYLSGRLVALATDRGFLARRPGMGFAWLGVMAVAVVVGAWANRHVFRRLAAVVEPFRDELVALSVKATLRRSATFGATGDAAGVARLTRHVEIVREAYAGVLMAVEGFVVTALGALLGLLSLAPALLWLVLPPLVVGLGVFVGALGGMARRQRASILADEGIATKASALSGGFRDIVAAGGESPAAATVEREIEAQAAATRELARFTAVRTLGLAVGGLLPVVLILMAGPRLVRHGATTGVILGALTYVLQGVYPALQTLMRELGRTGLWLLVALGRIVEAAAPEEADQAPDLPDARLDACDIRLRNVTFRYGPWAEPVIDGLDLDLPEREHLAVIGPSGVGKSTLAGVIAGLLEPEQGEVTLGGLPLRELGPRTLSRRRVLIPQEAYVFAGTLGENLTYLSTGVKPERIDEAVDLLGARTLVERLGGYEADVEASTLSAGERQLITLVRAYLSPAPLAILDEAACHLDPMAEAQVEEAFARRQGSLIVIAHRISSALRARRLLVMDGPHVLVGTHEELLARSSLYRDLVGHWGVHATEQPSSCGAPTI
ncbi:MAG TPA: ABC transporter ATP-binding protein [Acidimicrobiia bacterium]|nr:ABC transporter ATP-binding protein [Acidimicrobiia bacterium]